MSADLLPNFESTGAVIKYFIAITVQGIIFFLSYLILSRFIFRPVINILKKRQKRIQELEERTKKLENKNNILKEEFEWRIQGAYQLADERKEVTAMIGKCRADMILIDAKRETNRDLDNIIISAEKAFIAVQSEMNKKIDDFAEDIKNKMME